MKSEDKEVDINEVAIALEVDSDVIDKVRSGEVTHIVLQINEQNQNMILESIDGNLVLVIDDMPTTYISVDTEPGTRFSYQSADKPIVEDPNGDSCIWEVDFEVVPMPAEPRHYLMRWNPSISSFKEKDYKECVENMVHGMFRLDWSIYEWEEARRGDYFYMLRTGDYKAGIVFSGQFITDPYPADDWAGSTKRRMYVDLICMDPIDPRERPRISLEELKKEIPGFDWSKGHSGALLSEDVVKKLDELDDEEDDDFPLAN